MESTGRGFLFRLLVWLQILFGVHAVQLVRHEEAIHGLKQMRTSKHWDAGFPFATHYEPSELPVHDHPQGHKETFARFFMLSTAPLGDRDIGSGWNCGQSGEALDDMDNEIQLYSLAGACRYGEARHPGPQQSQFLRLGVANTTGVRRKEANILEMGVGIWHLAETHLTSRTARTSKGILKHAALQQQRNVRCVTGAPAPIRSNSEWAGSWTGVALLADYPTSPMKVSWAQEHWDSARILMSRSWIGQLPITNVTFYGFPSSPTWPKWKSLSESILTDVTRELVLGCGGVRTIAGDFNCAPGQLYQQKIWADLGWRSAQEVAEELFGHERCPTFGQTTEPDQVWLSPEAITLLRKVSVEDFFVGHSSVIVELEVPQQPIAILRWPRPSVIQWQDFPDFKHEQGVYLEHEESTMTEKYAAWAACFENSLVSYAETEKGKSIPQRCLGRARRLQPDKSKEVTPILKSSRQGEIEISSDLVGTAVRRWFSQARRLQSLNHSLRANKQSPSAIDYRASLWSCIIRARGFEGGFQRWWRNRSPILHADPVDLPDGLPMQENAEKIYAEFHEQFKAFEKWHLQQRTQILSQKHQESSAQLHRELRPPRKDTPDIFWSEHDYEVMAVDEDDNLIELDRPPQLDFDCIWRFENNHVQLFDFDGAVCRVPVWQAAQVEVGSVFTQRIFVSDIEEMHKMLTDFWKRRWQGADELPADQWQRITAFARTHMPQLQIELPQLEAQMIKESAQRMKIQAARGMDGVARADILNLPNYLMEPLMNILREVERGEQWPSQLQNGLVICAAKTSSAHEPGDYRPITVLPILYRLWSSLRTRHTLRLLQHYLPADILGFVPSCETSQVWLCLQSWIESCQSTGEHLCGISSDLQKAFNNIG